MGNLSHYGGVSSSAAPSPWPAARESRRPRWLTHLGAAGDQHVRHDARVLLGQNREDLQQAVILAHRLHAGLGRRGARQTGGLDRLGILQAADLDNVRLGAAALANRRRLTFGVTHGRQRLALGDLDVLLFVDQLLLDVGQRRLAHQAAGAASAPPAAPRRSSAAPPRSCGRSASCISSAGGVMSPISVSIACTSYALQRVADVLARFLLPLQRGDRKSSTVYVLRRVAEVVADDRLQHVVHQVLHRADARDHLRRVRRADVDDLRTSRLKVKPSFERTVIDDKLRVELCASVRSRPVEHDVGRRHQLDLHDCAG